MNNVDRQSVALILETNNLRGTDDPRIVVRSVARLLRHLRAQSRSIERLEEVVITHDGLDPASQNELEQAAGRSIRFEALPDGAGYYDAKNRGFDASTADIVVFADADCWPEPSWLEAITRPFFDPAVLIVAGRTTYRDDVLGAAATAIDFMYFPTPLGASCTRNFYANNVAFRRDVFSRFRYLPAEGIYRGHCQQLGFRLHAAGVPVRFVADARTVHRFPDSIREFVRLRLLRGADTVAIAPHLARSALPPPFDALGTIPTAAPLSILAARVVFSALAIDHQDLARARGVRRAACVAGVLGISLIDAAGVFARSTGLSDLGVHDGALTRDRLGYHENVDGLRERASHLSP